MDPHDEIERLRAEKTKLERELRDLCLCFTPQAIRDHFDGQAYDEDPVARAIESATVEQLEAMGAWALESDALYREFHDSLVAAAEEVLGVQP